MHAFRRHDCFDQNEYLQIGSCECFLTKFDKRQLCFLLLDRPNYFHMLAFSIAYFKIKCRIVCKENLEHMILNAENYWDVNFPTSHIFRHCVGRSFHQTPPHSSNRRLPPHFRPRLEIRIVHNWWLPSAEIIRWRQPAIDVGIHYRIVRRKKQQRHKFSHFWKGKRPTILVGT